ncbi:MAG: hypothetical protein JSS09_04800, partial [Verrucomicrobia bacterium]|nr:hypothetical protein [Verrucomicrobiota bacterium]
MLSSIAGIRSNTGTPSSIEIRGSGVVSTQPTNVQEAVGDVELPVHSLEDRTAGCFERGFYCEDAWKKKAIKGCVNEITLGCGY